MTDTGFQVPEAKLDRLPTCYGTDMVTGELVVLDEARGGYAARPPRLRIRRRRARLDGRRPARLRSDDAGRRMARARAHPFAAVDRADDHGPPHARAEGRLAVLRELLGYATAGASAGNRHRRATIWRTCPGASAGTAPSARRWHVDPREELVGVLMTQRRPDRLALPPVVLDFWTSAYQLIDD